MPVVHVVWFPHDTDTKRRVAQGITETLVKEIPCPPEVVDIIFHDNPAENFAHGGVLLANKK